MAKPGSQRNPTIEALKDRISRDPLSRAFLQLAEEYRKEWRFQEAVQVCLEGLQRHPTYHTARIALGRTYLESGDLESARRTFVEVLELQSENHLAAKLLGEIQTKMGDPAGAAATYRSILSFYPDDREVAALLDGALRKGSPSPTPAVPTGPPATTPPQSPRAGAPGVPRTEIRAPVPKPVRPSDEPAPDFRPEDFGGSAAPAGREIWSAPAVAPAAVRPAVPVSHPEADPIGDDALQTNTLAELYLRQGLVDRAIEVYRGMLRVDPGNQKAARRLSELAPAGGPPVEVRSAPAAAPEPPAELSGGSVEPSIAPPTRRDDRRETILRLERWLRNFSGTAAKGAPLR